MSSWFDGFEAADHAVNGTVIHARTGGRKMARRRCCWCMASRRRTYDGHRVASGWHRTSSLVLPDLRAAGDVEAADEPRPRAAEQSARWRPTCR